jgi:hypothetical protein
MSDTTTDQLLSMYEFSGTELKNFIEAIVNLAVSALQDRKGLDIHEGAVTSALSETLSLNTNGAVDDEVEVGSDDRQLAGLILEVLLWNCNSKKVSEMREVLDKQIAESDRDHDGLDSLLRSKLSNGAENKSSQKCPDVVTEDSVGIPESITAGTNEARVFCWLHYLTGAAERRTELGGIADVAEVISEHDENLEPQPIKGALHRLKEKNLVDSEDSILYWVNTSVRGKIEIPPEDVPDLSHAEKDRQLQLSTEEKVRRLIAVGIKTREDNGYSRTRTSDTGHEAYVGLRSDFLNQLQKEGGLTEYQATSALRIAKAVDIAESYQRTNRKGRLVYLSGKYFDTEKNEPNSDPETPKQTADPAVGDHRDLDGVDELADDALAEARSLINAGLPALTEENLPKFESRLERAEHLWHVLSDHLETLKEVKEELEVWHQSVGRLVQERSKGEN